MKFRLIILAASCGMLAACNSSSEPAPVASETATPAPVAAPPPVAPEDMKPAPEGLPSRIAADAIKAAGHKCASVNSATRDAANGTITATCSGDEKYHIYSVDGQGAVATPL